MAKQRKSGGWACAAGGLATALGLLVCACDPAPPPVAQQGFAPLGAPMPLASPAQLQSFERGRLVAQRRFTAKEGLGPGFNVVSCAACHERPVLGGSAGRYRNFGLVGERLPDGRLWLHGVNGIQRQFTLKPEAYVPTEPYVQLFATRNPIPFFGVGLLAELSDEEIMRRADPDDDDRDGISGRVNFDRGRVARFGRKSQTASLEGFVRGPMFNHAGITSDPLSDARRAQLPFPPPGVVASTRAITARPVVDPHGVITTVTQAQAAAGDLPLRDGPEDALDPELGEQDLFDLVSFTMLLAAPMPDPLTPLGEQGRSLFTGMGCAACHVPALTGPRGRLPAYSDLLIHDMGPALADGIEMGLATGAEFRTQPLWGVVATGPYLHDGRADTLDEAIRWHGGEGQRARDAYVQATQDERNAVVAFVVSLGGAAQATPGLLPAAQPLAPAGSYGAPVAGLTPAELDIFARGRAVFDRDFSLSGGLGPLFNGDSCRACHFDPVIGGAGPADVDVMRHGRADVATGIFVAPAMGTMAHRHAASALRPLVDPAANVFETRQTPALFGLGVIELIPDEVLLALADDADADGNGISGRVHRLADGRIGRFGWKANVPSLSEFARDALSNELGLSLPTQAGHSFGFVADGDAAPDPEVTAADLDALVLFLRKLAPPPRRLGAEPATEQAGEVLFTRIGCAACHVPRLSARDGTQVALYSDLLLHDVAPPALRGIAEGGADMREFRTPPLWGLGQTSPYMHNGRSFTIEDAIAGHFGEASAAVAAYGLLSVPERAQLLAFLASL